MFDISKLYFSFLSERHEELSEKLKQLQRGVERLQHATSLIRTVEADMAAQEAAIEEQAKASEALLEEIANGKERTAERKQEALVKSGELEKQAKLINEEKVCYASFCVTSCTGKCNKHALA